MAGPVFPFETPLSLTPTALPAWIGAAMAVGSLAAVALEQRGRLPNPAWRPRRDWLREAAWVGQYGQGTCVAVVVLLVGLLDAIRGWSAAAFVLTATLGTWAAGYACKRAAGRVRPGGQKRGAIPGEFLGFDRNAASWRESFPSSHAAGAMALSGALALLYPPAAPVFWALGAATAALRWLGGAHWLGDVLAGVALGLLGGWATATLWP